MNDVISIVIPIYNVEAYLDRCIKSILNQTYQNLDIILVDDGSYDNCPKMCDSYEKLDHRIHVIHKQNGGQSEARNYGIKSAKGKYITFIDADDFVDLDYIRFLYDLLKEYDAQISICSYKAIYENGSIITQASGKKYVLNPHDAIEKTLYHEDFNVSAWAKMYETSFFTDIEFPVGKIFEEVETLYKLFLKCDRIAVDLQSKYNYMIRENSTLTGAFSEKKLYLMTAYHNMGQAVLQEFPDLDIAITRANVYAHISTLRQMIFCKPRMKTKEKEIKYFVKSNRKKILKNKRVARRDKIAVLLIGINISIFKISWKLYCKVTGRSFY